MLRYLLVKTEISYFFYIKKDYLTMSQQKSFTGIHSKTQSEPYSRNTENKIMRVPKNVTWDEKPQKKLGVNENWYFLLRLKPKHCGRQPE